MSREHAAPDAETTIADTAIAAVAPYDAELVALRRDLHAHPELGWHEERTTTVLADRLRAAGLRPRALTPGGTGLLCDVGDADAGPTVALRADMDALPVSEQPGLPYQSTVPGISHACGHDVHAAAAVGAMLALADLHAAGRLSGRVRLVLQPAEELMPGGALTAVREGALDDVSSIFTVHCDPYTEVGRIGLRTGPITGAASMVVVRLTGPGGHTARPHLTGDLVYALGAVVTALPALLSRRVDPRAALSLVWGRVTAGTVANAIPQTGEVAGTVRCLDAGWWAQAPDLVRQLVGEVVAPYGVSASVEHLRGVPPVVNDAAATAVMARAARRVVGAESVDRAEQSLGGEDFAWFLEVVPGSLARLGVRTPGDPTPRDLHQGTFRADERAVGVGARLLAATAVEALTRAGGR